MCNILTIIRLSFSYSFWQFGSQSLTSCLLTCAVEKLLIFSKNLMNLLYYYFIYDNIIDNNEKKNR